MFKVDFEQYLSENSALEVEEEDDDDEKPDAVIASH